MVQNPLPGPWAVALQLRPQVAAMRATPGTPDESVAQLYSAWLAANPQLTPSDVQLSNLMCGGSALRGQPGSLTREVYQQPWLGSAGARQQGALLQLCLHLTAAPTC